LRPEQRDPAHPAVRPVPAGVRVGAGHSDREAVRLSARQLRIRSLIPPGCRVVRLPCLDAARHTAWRGRYPRAFALPDRWASWAWFARWRAARLCREEGIDVLWSTYPIATAHTIGATLAR